MRLFFTGAGGSACESIYKLLNDKYELYFGDADICSIDKRIPEIRRYEIPFANESNFIPDLINLCKKLKIDILIPGVDEELIKVAKVRHEFQPTKVLLPDLEFIKKMGDKFSMVKNFERSSLPFPKTIKLDDDLNKINFPCILKPTNGRGSKDVKILNFPEEAKIIRKYNTLNREELILQEKVEGIEYTVQMIANEVDQLQAVVPVRIEIKRGITIRAYTDGNEIVSKACVDIHNKFPTFGCYNIQLILDNKNNVFPFEINTRISTTICLVLASGVDPIKLFLTDAKDSLAPYKKNLRLQRNWNNYYEYLK